MKNDLQKVIGITGLIGSGKTTAGLYLKDKGAYFIDADAVVRGLYEPGNAGSKKIASFLGEEFLNDDGSVNKIKLSKFVFTDINKLKILNNLIHPIVFNEIKKDIGSRNDKIIVIEAAYFSDNMLGKLIDKLIFIDCPIATLVKRAKNKNEFKKILECQNKPAKFDFRVNNSKSREFMFKQLDDIWKDLV